jgi:hypothetical protein
VPTRLVARSPVRRGSEKGFARERGLGRRGERINVSVQERRKERKKK